MDVSSEAKLALINPQLARKIAELDAAFQKQAGGDPVCVIEALRGWNRQAKLYAQGRTMPGAIVTQAPAGHSWHEFGLAVDLCPQSILNQAGWAPNSPEWKQLSDLGQSLGLVSGLCWHHQDKPHFQLTGKFPVSPSDEVRQIFQQAGMQAVWQEAGLLDESGETKK